MFEREDQNLICSNTGLEIPSLETANNFCALV